MHLTREQILGIRDFALKTVNVPPWGGEVSIRSLTSVDNDAIQILLIAQNAQSAGEEVDSTSTLAKLHVMVALKVPLLSRTICDEEGVLLFNDDEGRARLERLDAEVLQSLFEISLDVNKLSGNAIDEEKKDSEMIRVIALNGSFVSR